MLHHSCFQILNLLLMEGRPAMRFMVHEYERCPLDNKFKSIYTYFNSNRKGEIMMTQPMNTMGLAYVNYDWSYFYGFGFFAYPLRAESHGLFR